MDTLTITPATTPTETVTPLRPSEAMRIGRMLYPVQISGQFFGGPGEACAIGAALAAYGYGPDSPGMPEAGFSTFDGLTGRREVESPCEHDGRAVAVTETVYHLNDRWHKWSTDRIATWLEGLGL